MLSKSPEADQTGNPAAHIRFNNEHGRLATDFPDLAKEWDEHLQVAINVLRGKVYRIHPEEIGILFPIEEGVEDKHRPRVGFDPRRGRIRFRWNSSDPNFMEVSNVSRVTANGRGHLQIIGGTNNYSQFLVISPTGEVNFRALPKSSNP